MKLQKKFSKMISIIYIVWTFYTIFLHYFTFFPIITSIRKSVYCEEIYFSNEMGGYIWHPEDENVELYQNVLFYFNDVDGNGSSRFNIMRKLQQEFPDYTILQMDYPGFGLSYNTSLTLKSLEKESSFVFREVLTSNVVEEYMCWGEGLGNWIMAMCIHNYTDYKPTKIIHYNMSSSIYQNIKDKFSILSFLFVGSYWNSKSIEYYYKKRFSKEYSKFIFFYNDTKKKKENSFETFYNLDFIPFDHKEIIYMKGNGNASILMKENLSTIKNIMI